MRIETPAMMDTWGSLQDVLSEKVTVTAEQFRDAADAKVLFYSDDLNERMKRERTSMALDIISEMTGLDRDVMLA